tara:strand:- start:281 stop:457 length:177 start_codon:yes stop_codon:yes gene_type:complete
MDENTVKAYEIYEKQGQDGVLAAVRQSKLKIDKWGFCEPCEYLSPIYQNCCLVCGESI